MAMIANLSVWPPRAKRSVGLLSKGLVHAASPAKHLNLIFSFFSPIVISMATAFVTGASRGVGRGIAAELAVRGFKVFATGRSIDSADLPASVQRIQCDHTRDTDTAAAFRRVEDAGEGLAVLVNSAWGGYERMVEDGEFTWSAPFWKQPPHQWSSMMDAGVRAAFFASAPTAKIMITPRRGVIRNVS